MSWFEDEPSVLVEFVQLPRLRSNTEAFPIRNYELITDISGSWNKEKTANVFMVKKSSLSYTLAVSYITAFAAHYILIY